MNEILSTSILATATGRTAALRAYPPSFPSGDFHDGLHETIAIKRWQLIAASGAGCVIGLAVTAWLAVLMGLL